MVNWECMDRGMYVSFGEFDVKMKEEDAIRIVSGYVMVVWKGVKRGMHVSFGEFGVREEG